VDAQPNGSEVKLVDNSKPIPAGELSRKLLRFIRPYRKWVVWCTAASLAKVAVDILMAYLVQNLTEKAQQGQAALLGKYIAGMVTLAVAGVLVNFVYKITSGRFSMYAMRDLQAAAVDRLANMRMAKADAVDCGDITSRLSTDMARIQDFLEKDAIDFAYQPLVLLGSITYLLLLSLKLLLLNIMVWLSVLIISSLLTGVLAKWSRNILEQHGRSNRIVKDLIGGFFIVKAFNLRGIMLGKYNRSVRQVLANEMRAETYIALITPVFLLTGWIPSVLCFLFGGYLVARGEMALSSLLTFVFLLNYIMRPAERIPEILQNFNLFRGAAQRLFELLEFPVEALGGARVEANPEHPVAFKKVSFSYPPGGSKVLDGVSFALKPGKITALVGVSGSGKSTIAKLICGLYRPDEGKIEFYRHDGAEIDLREARRLIAWVPQQHHFFPVTIGENIAYGKSGATREEIIAAAEMAHIHEEILALPLRYDTVIGDGGSGLSGGQLQRLSIARALIKQAPCLLLDEPTAALDGQTELLIRDTLLQYVGTGHTVLIAAHRFSTITWADEIIVLDKGRISECGSHQQLLNQNGLYRRLYQNQVVNG
jgi:ABC-type multidrug transport system fused ATPase/permease subunit